MVDAAIGPPPPGGRRAEGWRAGFTDWAWALRAALARNPWVLRIPISAPPSTPNSVAWMERGLACLRDTSLSEGEKVSVTDAGQRLRPERGDGCPPTSGGQPTHRRQPRNIDGGLGPAAGEGDGRRALPRGDGGARGGANSDTPGGPDDEFVFGLERTLDGVEALVSARADRWALESRTRAAPAADPTADWPDPRTSWPSGHSSPGGRVATAGGHERAVDFRPPRTSGP